MKKLDNLEKTIIVFTCLCVFGVVIYGLFNLQVMWHEAIHSTIEQRAIEDSK